MQTLHSRDGLGYRWGVEGFIRFTSVLVSEVKKGVEEVGQVQYKTADMSLKVYI